MKRDFTVQAQSAVAQKKVQLAQQQAADMHRDLRLRDVTGLDRMANVASNEQDWSRIFGKLNTLTSLDGAEKESLKAKLGAQHDAQPALRALQDRDVTGMEAALQQMGDKNRTPFLDDRERESYADALRSGIDRVRRAERPPDPKAVQASNAERIWSTLTGAWGRVAKESGGWTQEQANALFGPIVPLTSKSVGNDEWRAMQSFIESHTLKPGGKAKAPKDPSVAQDELLLYEKVMQVAQDNPEAFKNDQLAVGDGGPVKLSSLVGQLKGEHFVKFVDLQRSLKEAKAGAPKPIKYRDAISEKQLVDGLAMKYEIDPKAKESALPLQRLREVVQSALQEKAPDGNLPFPEKQKIAAEAVAARMQTEPTWFGLGKDKHTVLDSSELDASVVPHISTGFAKLVGGKKLTMKQATEMAPLYAQDEDHLLQALDVAGSKNVPVTDTIDLWGWAQSHKAAVDAQAKARGVEGDPVAWWTLALKMRNQ
jgi:hypothetical protein